MGLRLVPKYKVSLNLLGLLLILILQSCMSDIKPKDLKIAAASTVGTSGYPGCVVATGLSTSSVRVSFSFPANATDVSVYRDGIIIVTTRNRNNTNVIDINLQEGQTYHYECVATIAGVTTIGDRTVDGTTLAINAPVFSGINSVTVISPHSVLVTWPPTSGGAVAKDFKIYGTMNGAVNFSAASKATVLFGEYSVVISGLADDMPYRFGVRACTASGLCDTNTKEIALTLTDAGAATTVGAASVALNNGVAQVTAPWTETSGAVLKRRLYRSTTNNLSSILGTLVKTVNVTLVSDLSNPPTVIEDSTIIEGQTYYYVVRDEDPSGNITASTSIVSLVIGDLTAPIFSGLNSIALDTPAETSVLLGWTAIPNQPSDASGTTYYSLFKTESLLPGNPADSCSSGTLHTRFNSSSYTPGSPATYKVSGLSPRKKYSFCLKAQDSALNISSTTSYREQLMPDLTAPQFDGLQNISYSLVTNRFTLVWNPSTSSDIYQYKARVWKNTTAPTSGQITTVTYAATANSLGGSFGNTDFSFTDGDTVYFLVDACDNASPNYNTSDNCTAFANSTAISKNLIDTTPPQGFLGIASVSAPTQGIFQVNWLLPTDKSDYAGFKFYNIEETSAGVFTKIFLGDTYCTSNNCAANPKTTFNLAVGRDFHTYNLFMAAVDLFGNETRATDPIGTLTYSQITSIDTTKSNFTSSLSSAIVGGNINLGWNAATDNQYAKKNYANLNSIKYEIYRKSGSTIFDTGSYVSGVPNFAGDPTIVKVVSGLSALTYSDPTVSLIQGETYHYTVCARDESLNVQCDGFRTLTLSDNLAPVIEIARVDENPNNASWNLDIKVSDGVKSPGTVIVYVYAKYSDSSSDFPNGTGAQVSSAMTGAGSVAVPAEFVFYQDFLSNSSTYHYVNYFIKAVDASSNVSTTTLSHIIRRPTIAAAIQTATIVEDTLTPLTLTNTGTPGTDLSPTYLSYEIVSGPTNGTLTNCMDQVGSVNGLDLTCNYIGNPNFFGSDSFSYRVKDNLPISSTNVVTVNITVTNVNDNPVATSSSKSVMIGGYDAVDSSVINVVSTASDPDNTIVPGTNTLSVVTANPALSRTSLGNVSCSGLNCTVSHERYGMNKFGTATFPYQISDGVGGTSNSGTYTLKVYSQYTWTGAIDSDYTKPGNWCGSLHTNGNCIGATVIPPVGAMLVFSDLCINCNVTLPNTISLNSIILSSSFTGIVTIGSGVTLSTSRAFQAWGGTFDATLAAGLNITGPSGTTTFLVNKAAFKAPATSMAVNCNGGYTFYCFSVDTTISGTSFIHNNGTFNFAAGNGVKDFGAKNLVLHNFTINNVLYTDTLSLPNGTSFTVNNLTVTNGILLSNGTASARINGNLVQGYTSTTIFGNISNFNSTLTGANNYISMGNTAHSAGNVTVDFAGQAFSTGSNLLVKSLTIKDGTFNAPTGNLSIQKSFNTDNTSGAIPIFNHNNGTVIYTDSTTGSFTDNSVFSVPTTLKDFKVLRGYEQRVNMKGTLIVLGDMTIDGGGGNSGTISSNSAGGEIQLHGNLLNVYTYSYSHLGNGITLKLVGSNNQTITGSSLTGNSLIDNLSINKTGGNVSFIGTIRLVNNLDLTYTAGTVNMNTTKFILGGAAGTSPTITGGTTEFYDLVFGQAWNNNVTVSGDIIVGNSLTLAQAHTDSNKVSGGRILLKKDLNITQLSISGGSYFRTDIHLIGTGLQQLSWNSTNQSHMIQSNIYIQKPSGTAIFTTDFNLNYFSKNIYLQAGTLDFNGNNVQVNNITTEVGTNADSWSTLTKVSHTNNGGNQNP